MNLKKYFSFFLIIKSFDFFFHFIFFYIPILNQLIFDIFASHLKRVFRNFISIFYLFIMDSFYKNSKKKFKKLKNTEQEVFELYYVFIFLEIFFYFLLFLSTFSILADF